MSKPRNKDKQALTRLGKYLKGKERWKQLFQYQESTSKNSNKYVNVWVDTDYAGCLETRKSTSGGVIMINQHAVKTWSVTQDIIALSSGEAEYYGMVRGAAQGLGALTLLKDMGVSMKLKIKTDASVAKSIASRRGIGRVRHIEVNQLWLQERVNKGQIEIEKVNGKINRADLLTKHEDWHHIQSHMTWLNCKFESQRHTLMPRLAPLDESDPWAGPEVNEDEHDNICYLEEYSEENAISVLYQEMPQAPLLIPQPAEKVIAETAQFKQELGKLEIERRDMHIALDADLQAIERQVTKNIDGVTEYELETVLHAQIQINEIQAGVTELTTANCNHIRRMLADAAKDRQEVIGRFNDRMIDVNRDIKTLVAKIAFEEATVSADNISVTAVNEPPRGAQSSSWQRVSSVNESTASADASETTLLHNPVIKREIEASEAEASDVIADSVIVPASSIGAGTTVTSNWLESNDGSLRGNVTVIGANVESELNPVKRAVLSEQTHVEETMLAQIATRRESRQTQDILRLTPGTAEQAVIQMTDGQGETITQDQNVLAPINAMSASDVTVQPADIKKEVIDVSVLVPVKDDGTQINAYCGSFAHGGKTLIPAPRRQPETSPPVSVEQTRQAMLGQPQEPLTVGKGGGKTGGGCFSCGSFSHTVKDCPTAVNQSPPADVGAHDPMHSPRPEVSQMMQRAAEANINQRGGTAKERGKVTGLTQSFPPQPPGGPPPAEALTHVPQPESLSTPTYSPSPSSPPLTVPLSARRQ